MSAPAGLSEAPTAPSRLSQVDFDDLPFSSVFSDHMMVAELDAGGWGEARIQPYGPLPLPPNISGLQYGISAFEGLTARRSAAGDVLIFRPWENARRLNRTAVRLAMPEVPEELFLDSLRRLLRLDRGWVPPLGKGALYIRPSLFSVDPSMRVKPAERYLFTIVSAPFGTYYSAPVEALVEQRYVRAFPGGTGDVKPAGNYAPTLVPEREAQAAGCTTVLWLDGVERRLVEECGVLNVFFVVEDRILTPALSGTLLPGITRDSALYLLRAAGWRVEERPIAIDEVVERHRRGELRECFGTGTAALVSQIGRLRYAGADLVFPRGGEVGEQVRRSLLDIMTGEVADPAGWVERI